MLEANTGNLLQTRTNLQPIFEAKLHFSILKDKINLKQLEKSMKNVSHMINFKFFPWHDDVKIF